MQKILIILVLGIITSNVSLAQDPYITTPGEFGQTFMSYQLSENILYSGTSRFGVTSTVDQSNVSALFNSKYEETAITVPVGQAATITIDFQGKAGPWIQNPAGYVYLNFFDQNYPDSITAVLYDSTGETTGIEAEDWVNASTTSPYILLRAHIPSWLAGLKKIEIRVKSRSGVVTKISEIEYILEHTGQFESGLVNKWNDNTLWSNLVIKDITNNKKASISNTGTGYFQKIGIGTENINNDSAKLFVEGGIFARLVKVSEDSWPDYVFAPGYKLPSLKEVQAYIKKYNHLPGIPSASEVQAKGLDIGRNQASLMQKIEELTLYMIKQNREIEKLRNEVRQLKRRKS